MIDKITGSIVSLVCNVCGHKYEKPIPQTVLKFNKEFQQYDNLSFECDKCGTIEFFNMNIEESLLPFEIIEELNIPNEEVNQRKYVIDLMKLLREDFVNERKSRKRE